MTFGTVGRGKPGAQFVPRRRTHRLTLTDKNEANMNLNRRSHREEVLFVLALVVPAIFAGARYVQSEREIALISQASQVQVAQSAQIAQIKKS
jgi:hypothetical protein